MFKIQWDKENNGIILSDAVRDDMQLSSPRPVYHEELTLLGFNTKFTYPKSKNPILWAIDRRYFYKGELVAEVRGGSIHNDPNVVFNDSYIGTTFEPILVELIIKNNIEYLKILENESMDFVRNTYTKYKDSTNSFVVAFSGGKDSQVILDIVSRAIQPSDYKVVFTDTDMEIPLTYQTVAETEKYYKEKYNGLEFIVAKSDKSAIDLWNSYGPPSRINRWCCAVLKTALFGRMMKELLAMSKQPKLVVFEGVRADESARRESYERVGEGVKHINIINSRAIFKWNTTEIYLYMLYRDIKINPAYRFGLSRVGCSVCPFASDWSEFIIRKLYPDFTAKYVNVIKRMARNIGISSEEKINEYIDSGNWKKNAGGKGLEIDNSRVDILTKEPDFKAVVTCPKTDFFTWLHTVGNYIVKQVDERNYSGEISYNKEVFKFAVEYKEDSKIIFEVHNTSNKILFTSALNKVLNKVAYCEKCGVCEVECPTGALCIYNGHDVDPNKCVKCRKCLDINSKGCIIADRKAVSEGGTKVSVKSSGIDKYSTFGLREKWLDNYFSELNNWFENNGGLGSKQVPAMINWLRECELLEVKEKKSTDIALKLKDKYYKDSLLVWQILWVNLYFNSMIVGWYVDNVKNNVSYSKGELQIILKESYPNFSEGTLNNPLSALINTFDSSPLGNEIQLGVLEKKGNAVKCVTKIGGNNINPTVLCYFLYKLSEDKKRYEWTVSDFYNNGNTGPFELFGCSQEYFLNCLRFLQEKQNGLIKVDLLGGLDNIHVNEDYSSLDVLKMLL